MKWDSERLLHENFQWTLSKCLLRSFNCCCHFSYLRVKYGDSEYERCTSGKHGISTSIHKLLKKVAHAFSAWSGKLMEFMPRIFRSSSISSWSIFSRFIYIQVADVSFFCYDTILTKIFHKFAGHINLRGHHFSWDALNSNFVTFEIKNDGTFCSRCFFYICWILTSKEERQKKGKQINTRASIKYYREF